jgi:lipoate-protein ligase A
VILWTDGAFDAVENMRRDTSLLERAERRPNPGAVLRVYRFEPPGITLGYAQDPARVLDLERCQRDGIAWAVRPTGGRAIFHDQEWTYALAARLDDPVWGGARERAYDRISSLIVESLRRLGVPAALVASLRRARGVPGPARARRDVSCFAATARHEVVLGGRKLAGSAQRRTATALLQQGSILLGPGHLRLTDYLNLSEREREDARAELERNAASAVTSIDVVRDFDRWRETLVSVLGDVRVQDGAPLNTEAATSVAATPVYRGA